MTRFMHEGKFPTILKLTIDMIDFNTKSKFQKVSLKMIHNIMNKGQFYEPHFLFYSHISYFTSHISQKNVI